MFFNMRLSEISRLKHLDLLGNIIQLRFSPFGSKQTSIINQQKTRLDIMFPSFPFCLASGDVKISFIGITFTS